MWCYFVLILQERQAHRSLDAALGLSSTIAIKGSLRSGLQVHYHWHKLLNFFNHGGSTTSVGNLPKQMKLLHFNLCQSSENYIINHCLDFSSQRLKITLKSTWIAWYFFIWLYFIYRPLNPWIYTALYIEYLTYLFYSSFGVMQCL